MYIVKTIDGRKKQECETINEIIEFVDKEYENSNEKNIELILYELNIEGLGMQHTIDLYGYFIYKYENSKLIQINKNTLDYRERNL